MIQVVDIEYRNDEWLHSGESGYNLKVSFPYNLSLYPLKSHLLPDLWVLLWSIYPKKDS